MSVCCCCTVAPFVGAWIEIVDGLVNLIPLPSLRSSERGLKSALMSYTTAAAGVAPFVGAWIEIDCKGIIDKRYYGRSVRRSVD